MQMQIRSGATQIGEVEAKEILRAYEFNVLDGHLARTGDEAVEIAERIGYPVVLKISSPDIIHKSDFGGVRINLANAEQVRDAFDLMMLRIQKRAPNAHLRGAFVEKMGQRGREVILGMTRDPQFGPMLMFGLGGIFVEVMKDVTFHLAPITAEEAMQMLKGTRSYACCRARAARRRWTWKPSPARCSASASSRRIIPRSWSWTSTRSSSARSACSLTWPTPA